jgi:predicted permease
MSDLRYALRLLRRTPVATAVAVLSLALGIGANTAILTVADALMWRTLPVHDSHQLVLLEESIQYSLFERLREDGATAGDLSAIVRTDRYNVNIGASISGDAGGFDSGPVRLALVSGNYFPMLGVGAARGRALASDDDAAAARPVAVIADAYWTRRFGRSDDVLGQTLRFGDLTCEIVGVAPRSFVGEWIGRPADVWIPIVWQPRVMLEIPVGLPSVPVTVVGRLHDGVSRAQAQSAWQLVMQRVLRAQAGANATPERIAEIARESLDVGTGARGYSPQRNLFAHSLGILIAAVAAVLLIACANIANLLLARAEARRREMAVRRAVGATRGRLIRQMLSEGLVLATLGGVLGLLAAYVASSVLLGFVRAGPATSAAAMLSIDLEIAPDLRMLGITAGLCVVTGILVGLVPALRGSRQALAPALIGRGPASSGAGRGLMAIGPLLVVAQVAISIVLLVGAGLLTRTLRNLASEDVGFDRDRLLLVWTLPGQTGGRGAAAADFWHDALARVAALPGVVSVSASNQGVLNGADLTNIGTGPGLRIEGEPLAPSGLPGLRSFIAPGLFRTMGVPILAGREFTEADNASTPRGVVISRSLARHYFGERDAVGHRIWFPEDTTTPTLIIGVVGDVLIGGPREVARRPGFTYFSYRDREAPRRLRVMTMVVRTAVGPRSMANQIRATLQTSELQLPVLKVDTVDEQIADVLVQERLVTTVSNVFGLLSLVLASIGLYGVISYAVARRTNEIGIRMALGASRHGILRAILAESLTLVVVGVTIGVPAALAVTRLIGTRLFGVGSSDPLTIAGAVALLAAVTTVAALLPARRAARVDPMVALRAD